MSSHAPTPWPPALETPLVSAADVIETLALELNRKPPQARLRCSRSVEKQELLCDVIVDGAVVGRLPIKSIFLSVSSAPAAPSMTVSIGADSFEAETVAP